MAAAQDAVSLYGSEDEMSSSEFAHAETKSRVAANNVSSAKISGARVNRLAHKRCRTDGAAIGGTPWHGVGIPHVVQVPYLVKKTGQLGSKTHILTEYANGWGPFWGQVYVCGYPGLESEVWRIETYVNDSIGKGPRFRLRMMKLLKDCCNYDAFDEESLAGCGPTCVAVTNVVAMANSEAIATLIEDKTFTMRAGNHPFFAVAVDATNTNEFVDPERVAIKKKTSKNALANVTFKIVDLQNISAVDTVSFLAEMMLSTFPNSCKFRWETGFVSAKGRTFRAKPAFPVSAENAARSSSDPAPADAESQGGIHNRAAEILTRTVNVLNFQSKIGEIATKILQKWENIPQTDLLAAVSLVNLILTSEISASTI